MYYSIWSKGGCEHIYKLNEVKTKTSIYYYTMNKIHKHILNQPFIIDLNSFTVEMFFTLPFRLFHGIREELGFS